MITYCIYNFTVCDVSKGVTLCGTNSINCMNDEELNLTEALRMMDEKMKE